jgi:hypothetical protein
MPEAERPGACAHLVVRQAELVGDAVERLAPKEEARRELAFEGGEQREGLGEGVKGPGLDPPYEIERSAGNGVGGTAEPRRDGTAMLPSSVISCEQIGIGGIQEGGGVEQSPQSIVGGDMLFAFGEGACARGQLGRREIPHDFDRNLTGKVCTTRNDVYSEPEPIRRQEKSFHFGELFVCS